MAGEAQTLTTHETPEPAVGRLVVLFTADDTSAGDQSLTMPAFDGRILSITTVPTGTPTDNYDVELRNADGFDILGTAGANRDTATTERAAVTNGYVSRHEATTLHWLNNTQVDATSTVTLHYTQDM